MTGGLGRRYARALLGLARETGALDAAGRELASATATFAQPELHAVVLNPAIAPSARRAIVGEIVAKLGPSPIVGTLIRMLADRERLDILADVARAYQKLVDAELGRAQVKIRSATALSAAELAQLEELARRITGSREIVVSTEVDADLIGGVVLDAAGTVYDGSVKTQLGRLARTMAGDAA